MAIPVPSVDALVGGAIGGAVAGQLQAIIEKPIREIIHGVGDEEGIPQKLDKIYEALAFQNRGQGAESRPDEYHGILVTGAGQEIERRDFEHVYILVGSPGYDAAVHTSVGVVDIRLDPGFNEWRWPTGALLFTTGATFAAQVVRTNRPL